ncbi:hypothetical protein [Streptomyces sp. NPDC048659]|uniref:hypothetical protein n=1 Tax=Streptomyces sp. NPDC048659 TaxID=3155489 RepID=UPI00342C2C01
MHVGRAVRGATRAGGALAHLLLVVVLALGVFVMHAVGHPEGASGQAAQAEGHGAGAAAPPDTAALPGVTRVTGPSDPAGASTVSPVTGATDTAGTPGTPGMAGMTGATGSTGATDVAPAHGGLTAVPAGGAAHDGTHGSTHDSGAGMDMTTLCVAVLGAWLLAALLRAALGRRPGGAVPLPARLLPSLGPNAPPRPPDLAQLSVLRT